MDVSQVNDINQLKVMAYDAIAAQEQAQRNLQVINQRIAQVSTDGTLPKASDAEQLPSQEALSLDDAAKPSESSEPTPDASSVTEGA